MSSCGTRAIRSRTCSLSAVGGRRSTTTKTGSSSGVPTEDTKKEERAEARSSLELTGGEGQLVQGVTDGDELVVGLGADGADGHDADHGDEGEQEGVLHQRGATLVLDVQAGDQVAVDVHGVFPFREVRSP